MSQRLELRDVVVDLINTYLADTHTATIGRVIAVNSKTIDVQPVLNRQVKGESISLPVFSQVPPVFLQGGGSYHAFPIAKGDYCLLIITERCFDSWYNGQDGVSPVEYRMHDYSDGFAIVGINPASGAITIPSVIQETGDTNQDGDFTHQGDREQTGNYTITGNITQVGDVDLTGNLTQVGDMAIDGKLDVTGDITCNDIIVNGISFNSHVHGGVVSGGSNTGGPQ